MAAIFLCFLAGAPVAPAADTLTTVKVSATASTAFFLVDGGTYQGTATFLWPVGSKHTLSLEKTIQEPAYGARLTFAGWSAAGVGLTGITVVITADTSVPAYLAQFDAEYLLRLGSSVCAPEPCQAPGMVTVNGSAFADGAEVWLHGGAVVDLQAAAAAGWVFAGWQQGSGPVYPSLAYSFVLNGYTVVTARFVPAHRIRLETSPPGLQVMADRTPVTTPYTFEWGLDTVHTLGPVSPQGAGPRPWVFGSWSDGGAAVHAYRVQVAPEGQDTVITAAYVAGARVSFLTEPLGLKILVDGSPNPYPGYIYTWSVGETHRAEAPLHQNDAQGKAWVFRAWADGAPAVRDVTVADPDADTGLRFTAAYDPLGKLTIQSLIPGASVTADGAACPLPCSLDRPPGTQVVIAAGATVPAGDGTRYDFDRWSDGVATPERTITLGEGVLALNLDYRYSTRLTATSDPPGGVRWTFDPVSPDGWYDARTRVIVSAKARAGYKFQRFEGDLSGVFTSGVLSMSEPRTVRAVLDRVPYIADAGVRNAAAETPQEGVAPGSVIAIFGESLAPALQSGPDSPLVQTLAGVTVRMDDSLLPLFFVSPEQINAQLPSATQPGTHSLTVRWEGKPEVSSDFDVYRNAPGLFVNTVDDNALAVAAHQNADPVTADAPARPGETVTVYGTGFGPSSRTPLDGFAVPAKPRYDLVDTVEVALGDTTVKPDWAGAAPGRVGVNAVRFVVPDDLPAGGRLELKVRVNGIESNTVLLTVGDPAR